MRHIIYNPAEDDPIPPPVQRRLIGIDDVSIHNATETQPSKPVFFCNLFLKRSMLTCVDTPCRSVNSMSAPGAMQNIKSKSKKPRRRSGVHFFHNLSVSHFIDTLKPASDVEPAFAAESTSSMAGPSTSSSSSRRAGDETRSQFSMLLKLDDWRNPGLSRDVFRSLFGSCGVCLKVMTKNALDMHECDGDVVIDLTVEDELLSGI